MIDVTSKRCEAAEGCSKRAICGFVDGPPLYCGTHKLAGMVNVKNKGGGKAKGK
jgi:hypothetical protein